MGPKKARRNLRKTEVPTDTPTEFELGDTAAVLQRRREEREQGDRKEAEKKQRERGDQEGRNSTGRNFIGGGSGQKKTKN